MKKHLVALITLIILSIPVLCSAAGERPGPYFSAFLGTSFAKDATISGIDYSPNPDISFDDQVSFDPGIYTGGTFGYDFGHVRLEGELSYRHANLDTVTSSAGNRFRSVDGNLGVFATMFNVFFDMHNTSPVTPYVGGGLGFANVFLSETTGYNSAGQYGILYDQADDTVFAYQFGGGVDIALNKRFSLDLGYRYFLADKVRLEGDWITSNLKFESHNALVGFKFKF